MISLGLLLVLAVYGLVIWVIARYVGWVTQSRRWFHGLFWGLLALPGAVFAFWFLPPYLVFKNYCDTQAGTEIKRVLDVPGYLNVTKRAICANCWEEIVRGKFDYLEFLVRPGHTNDEMSEAGYWRVHKTERPSELCETVDKKVARIHPDLRNKWGYTEFFHDQCIAIEKVDEPISEYAYELGSWVVRAPLIVDGRLMKWGVQIWHRESDEVLAESVNFIYQPFDDWMPVHSKMTCGGKTAPGRTEFSFLNQDAFKAYQQGNVNNAKLFY